MLKHTELFPSFSFTEDDLKVAHAFNDTTIGFLQTELADRVKQRLSLRFDPTQPHEFIQQEAYLTGQMELLTELLLPQPSALLTEPQN